MGFLPQADSSTWLIQSFIGTGLARRRRLIIFLPFGTKEGM